MARRGIRDRRFNVETAMKLQFIAICWAMVSALSGCSNFVAYSGAPLPDTEIATVNCYSRNYLIYFESCRFQALDGLRPEVSELFTNTGKLRPGKHWLEIAFESYFGGGGGITDVCAFDMDLQSGYRYKIQAHSLKTEIGQLEKHGYPGFYAGSVTVEISAPGMEATHQLVPVTCSFAGGSMCRKTEDCVRHPDIRCVPQMDQTFGACQLIDTQKSK